MVYTIKRRRFILNSKIDFEIKLNTIFTQNDR
jgi:hypothetical protein